MIFGGGALCWSFQNKRLASNNMDNGQYVLFGRLSMYKQWWCCRHNNYSVTLKRAWADNQSAKALSPEAKLFEACPTLNLYQFEPITALNPKFMQELALFFIPLDLVE